MGIEAHAYAHYTSLLCFCFVWFAAVLHNCPGGRFGADCSGICHCLAGSDVCLSEDGRCTHGLCQHGWTNPPYCQTGNVAFHYVYPHPYCSTVLTRICHYLFYSRAPEAIWQVWRSPYQSWTLMGGAIPIISVKIFKMLRMLRILISKCNNFRYFCRYHSLTHCCAWPAEGRSVLHVERSWPAIQAAPTDRPTSSSVARLWICTTTSLDGAVYFGSACNHLTERD